jgi:hypothetical protein
MQQRGRQNLNPPPSSGGQGGRFHTLVPASPTQPFPTTRGERIRVRTARSEAVGHMLMPLHCNWAGVIA